MDRKEHIKHIKGLESEFLNKVENTIQNKYQDFLFEKYKKSVQGIATCYQNPNTNLAESSDCATKEMENYLEREKRFEQLFRHYETSIGECLRLCRFDIKNPILDCYEKCFSGFTELVE